MSNNIPDGIRQKLYQEYEESLFKLALYDLAEEEGKKIFEESKNPSFVQPPPKVIAAFEKRLNKYCKKAKDKKRSRVAFTRLTTAMAILVTMFVSFMIGVDAFRVKVLNLWLDVCPEYTSFELRDDTNYSGDEDGMTINWTQSYVPCYIPDGYKVSEIQTFESMRMIQFENKQDAESTILYTESNSSVKTAVDTENASMKTVKINQSDGTLIVKGNMVTVVWNMDDRLFLLQARNCFEDEVLKMAEGVKFVA